MNDETTQGEAPNPAIATYRKLTQVETDLINEVKEFEAAGKALLKKIEAAGAAEGHGRWLSIGLTHIEQGAMAIVRAVAKPLGL